MFKNSHFGLNISDHSLRFVKITAVSGGLRVDQYGEYKIQPGIVEAGEIKDAEKLEKILTALKKEEGLKLTHVSLPIATLEKDAIKNYVSVFKRSGIKVLSFEFEAQSLSRLLIKKGDTETYMIVDFGKKNTGVCVVSDGAVELAVNFNFGGVRLSNLIRESLNLTFAEAEEIKKKYGLHKKIENEEAFPILLDGIAFLHDEVAKHFLHWHTHRGEDSKDPIKKIIFCGGSSNLISLAEYFKTQMKHPIEIADVWINIPNPEKNIPEMTFSQSLSFAPALGAALGGFQAK